MQETKAELSGLGNRIEEVRSVCRQLHTHLRRIPECNLVPFEGEADALMDRWLDVSSFNLKSPRINILHTFMLFVQMLTHLMLCFICFFASTKQLHAYIYCDLSSFRYRRGQIPTLRTFTSACLCGTGSSSWQQRWRAGRPVNRQCSLSLHPFTQRKTSGPYG